MILPSTAPASGSARVEHGTVKPEWSSLDELDGRRTVVHRNKQERRGEAIQPASSKNALGRRA